MNEDLFAADSSTENRASIPTVSTVLNGSRNPHRRPSAPSRKLIWCNYDGESITVDFASPEGVCSVYITDLNTNVVKSYSIDSSELSVSFYVGAITRCAVEIATENGNSYTGILEIAEL